MKKIVFALLAIAVLFSACKKDEPANNPKEVEVEFVIQQTDFGSLKSTNEDVPECQDLPWSYVKFTLGGTTYTSNILNVGGELLTQAVKLPSGQSYALTEFLVYSDVLPLGPENDVLVRAAPAIGSEYHNLMEHPLDVDVEVFEFSKRQVIVDVLCFEDLYWEAFGFNWFEMNDVKIERQCFFGDVCVDDLTEFEGSLYAQQTEGLQMDMPAIFTIYVYKEDELIKTFTNEPWLGEGQCLEIFWANDLDLVENFSFALYVLLPDDNGMSYQRIDSIAFQDDNCPDPGTDGVVDFVLGDCQIDVADLTYEWPPAGPDFVIFNIRNNDGTIVAPWDGDITVAENADEDGFAAETPRSGQKVGYGTNFFDNAQINTFETVNWDKVSGKAGVVSYLNFWVTDGVNYAVISSENDYRGTDFGTRQEWKVFEYDAGVGLDWLFDSGTGARDGAQYLTLDGTRITLADLSNNIILVDPGSPYPAYVGTGAPRGGYGFQLIFGDTQSNFVGDYHLENLNLTVDGTVYTIGN